MKFEELKVNQLLENEKGELFIVKKKYNRPIKYFKLKNPNSNYSLFVEKRNDWLIQNFKLLGDLIA